MKPSRPLTIDDHPLLRAAVEEAQRSGRTVAEQICHWAHIGRRAEAKRFYDEERVRGALSGKVDTVDLLPLEESVWEERFIDLMSRPGPGELEFFKDLRKMLRAKEAETASGDESAE